MGEHKCACQTAARTLSRYMPFSLLYGLSSERQKEMKIKGREDLKSIAFSSLKNLSLCDVIFFFFLLTFRFGLSIYPLQ